MTSDQITAINSAMTTTTGEVITDFIAILPTIGKIIAIAFVIFLVSYWLKKLKRAK